MTGTGGFGSQNRAADRCKLDSKWERIVHDAIVGAGLTHVTHPPLDDGRGGLADFLVQGVYVEVWGLDDPDYKLRRSEKLRFYFSKNCALVEFEPSDFEGKARAIRAKVQEIAQKAKGKQERIKGTDLPEPRDLRLDEFMIAESMARENGELGEIDEKIAAAKQRVDEARVALQGGEEMEKALHAERHEIVLKWMT